MADDSDQTAEDQGMDDPAPEVVADPVVPAAPVVNYLINRVSDHYDPTMVDFGGEQIQALVPTTEVELVDETGQHGSICLRFKTADERAYAKATYVQGQTIQRAA